MLTIDNALGNRLAQGQVMQGRAPRWPSEEINA